METKEMAKVLSTGRTYRAAILVAKHHHNGQVLPSKFAKKLFLLFICSIVSIYPSQLTAKIVILLFYDVLSLFEV